HVTVSPGSSLYVAARVAMSPLLVFRLVGSSQRIDVSDQPDFVASVDVYVPGSWFATVTVPPSPIVPEGLPVKPKVAGSPEGTVSFLSTRVPLFVFVYVQVTVSPGSRFQVTTRVATLPALGAELPPSSHAIPVTSQPVRADSVEVYVPGFRLDTVIVPPSPIV